MALIPPVADQPTVIGKLQALWDFAVVKIWAICGAFATIGMGIPAVQATFPDWHFLEWMPAIFIHICQFCAVLTFLGIVPARGIAQPNLPTKQALRAANSNSNPPAP